MIDIVKSASRRAGGIPALAELLGVSRQALYQWRRVPADKVQALVRATGLSPQALRPDLHGGGDSTGTGTRYEDDVPAWAIEQAGHLRHGRFDRLDVANLCEEIDDLASRHKDEIESRLTILLVHLLKLSVQPEKRAPSWDATILEQRARIARRLARAPSLRGYPAQVLVEEYDIARRKAALETGLPLGLFPVACPFAIDDVLDLDFVPGPSRNPA